MISAHFAQAEFEVSNTAERVGIDNSIPPLLMPNLMRLVGVMEQVRQVLGGHPISISSGYRSMALNGMVKGSSNSAHVQCRAADFICPRAGTPLEICEQLVSSAVEFDQLIHEFGRWVHLSIPAKGQRARRQLLTIDRLGTRLGLHEVR